MHVFIDESGDLGFRTDRIGSSNFFVVSAIKITDPNQLRRIIKKHRKRDLKKKYKEKSEIKFSNTSPENRRRILEDISKINNIEIFYVAIDKKNAYQRVKENSPITIHSYLLKLLIEKCCNSPLDEDLVIIIDRTFSPSQQETLELYLRTQNQHMLSSKHSIKIVHKDSEKDHGIMCSDFIVGSIFHKYEKNNDSYYRTINSKIKGEKRLF